jgi:hypothetical protein
MIEILALIFAGALGREIEPTYMVGSCYEITDPQWRPGLIKIESIGVTQYTYRIKLRDKWSEEFKNEFDTIEIVYSNKVNCQ